MNTTRTIAWGKWMMAAVLLALLASVGGCQATGAQANMNATFAQDAAQRAQSASAKAATYTCAAAASYRDAAAQASQRATEAAAAAAGQRDQANGFEALAGQLNPVRQQLESAQAAFTQAADTYDAKMQIVRPFEGPGIQTIDKQVIWDHKTHYYDQFAVAERAAAAVHDAYGKVLEAVKGLQGLDLDTLAVLGGSQFSDVPQLVQRMQTRFDEDTAELEKARQHLGEAKEWLNNADVLDVAVYNYGSELHQASNSLVRMANHTTELGRPGSQDDDPIDRALHVAHRNVEDHTVETKKSADAAAAAATEANRNAILAAKACGQLPPEFEEYVVENPFNDMNNPYPDWNSTFWDFSSP